MKDPQLIEQIVDFVQKVQAYHKGMRVHIEQKLSVAGDNYDRHVSATANFSFKLMELIVRTSGNIMMFLGEEDDYELHCDAMTELESLGNNSYRFLEVLSDRVYRRTTIRFYDPHTET